MTRRFILEVLRGALCAAAVCTQSLASPPAPAANTTGTMVTGRALNTLFLNKDLQKLYEQFGEKMAAAMPVEKLDAFRRRVEARLGAEKDVVDESITQRDSFQVYTRLSHFDKFEGVIETAWALDSSGKVAGFYVRPAQKEAASPYLDYGTKTPLHLPFHGSWFVFWGGRTLPENYHASSVDQRFAVDLLIQKDGKSHDGDGTSNAQFYCYGQTIVAPGPGKVIVVVDSVAENHPGEMNRSQPAGNHIIIDHGNGEFSLLAHFQPHSITVKPGATVKTGDVLGKCGNSGNSSEPHLHYHLQNTGEFGKSQGLPAQFLDYVADGAKVERGEPKKGQIITAP